MTKLLLFVFVITIYILVKNASAMKDKEEIQNIRKGKGRERCPIISAKEYALILSLLRRTYAISVKDRTKMQKNMYRKISFFGMTRQLIDDPFLGKKVPRVMINGKILLPTNEIDPCIRSYYSQSKGDGAKKLAHTMRCKYYGIGETTIQKCLNSLESHRLRQPRFDNKAPLKSITSKRVMDRHQVDLVDLSSVPVSIDGVQYRYILSVLDVFSRFLWLRPIQKKSADAVASELYKIYIEFGPPRILQCDQGSEFKGVVKKLCSMIGTKLIYSSSNHPQSQGKDERSHRTWKEKLRHDILNTRFEGVCDWATGLPVLQRIYNEGWHRSIDMTPYECLFGIKSNHMTNINLNTEGEIDIEITDEIFETSNLSENVTEHLKILKELRQHAEKSSRTVSEKMIKTSLKSNPPSKYFKGDNVLVKHQGKDTRVKRGGTSVKAPKVVEGTVLDTDFENYRYEVEFLDDKRKKQKKWFKVNLLTSKSHEEEKQKKFHAACSKRKTKTKLPNNQPKNHLSFIDRLQRMVLESVRLHRSGQRLMDQLLLNAKSRNLILHSDNEGNGNCMFEALSHQLLTYGIDMDHFQIRRHLVSFLRENPVFDTRNGMVNFRDFIYDNNGWDAYIEAMSSDGTWGDNLILIAAANCLRARITIISILGNREELVIEPYDNNVDINLYLGHVHELHYVSLIPEEESNDILCESCGLISTPGHICNTAEEQETVPTAPNANDLVEDLKNFLKNSELFKSTYKHDHSKCRFWKLAKDHNSMLWSNFMQMLGVFFAEEIVDGEYFLLVPKELMDLFDDFRQILPSVCGTLVLVYLTVTVKLWIEQLSDFLKSDVQEILPNVFALTQRANEDFQSFLSNLSTENPGVETEYDT